MAPPITVPSLPPVTRPPTGPATGYEWASPTPADLHRRPARTRPATGPRCGSGDHGAVSAQLVIATPLLLLMLLLSVQMAVWLHAVHIAQTGAAQALAAARAEDGSTGAGRVQAGLVLAELGSGLLIDPHVEVTRDGTEVHAQITGTAQVVVPGLRLPVNTVAHGPAEAWTTEATATP